jgi:hypothetical protein
MIVVISRNVSQSIHVKPQFRFQEQTANRIVCTWTIKIQVIYNSTCLHNVTQAQHPKVHATMKEDIQTI